MIRDETKRAAEEALWLDIEFGAMPMEQPTGNCRKYARAYLDQCERDEPALEALKNCVQWMIEQGCSHEYAVLIDAKAAIKAIEEDRG